MEGDSRLGRARWTNKRRLLFCLLSLALIAAGCDGSIPNETPAIATPVPDAAEPAGDPTGRLVYLRRRPEGVAVVAYDLATAAPAILFQAEPEAWLVSATVHPDSDDLVLAYAPPPPGRQPQLGFAGIYHLPPGAAAPVAVHPFVPNEINYSNPFFSPDGRHLYFLEAAAAPEAATGLALRLLRQDWPVEEPALAPVVVATGVTWPRLSADGSQLVYIQPAPDGAETALSVMDLATGATRSLLAPDSALTVDAPLFDPAGEWIYFSALAEAVATLPWFDRLLGVRIAAAHAAPSDWWRVPIAGGTPEKLTDVRRVSMLGAFAPDGSRFAYISGDGLYLMNPDGSDAVTLIDRAPLFGMLEWRARS